MVGTGVAGKSGCQMMLCSEGVDNPRLIVINVLLGTVALYTSYLVPMFFIGHWFGNTVVCLGICTAACAALYFTWYCNLEADDDGGRAAATTLSEEQPVLSGSAH